MPMSYFPRLSFTVPLVLSLAVLLATDALIVAPGDAAAAADEPRPASEAAREAITTPVCTDGFGDTASKSDMSLHGVTLTDGGALAVGFTRKRSSDELGRRTPASLLRHADGWSRVYTSSPGNEDGLIAVSTRAGSDTWAVGFTTIRGRVMPLAMKWTGSKWKTSRPRTSGAMASLFTDVTVIGSGSPLAVGYRMTASGKRQPIATRLDGRRWRNLPIRIGRKESITLTGVAPNDGGGVWAVGHGGPGAEIQPVIYLRDGRRWRPTKAPRLKGEAALTDVVSTGPDESWAVGYQRSGELAIPLVVRWDGKTWTKVPGPGFDSTDAMLTAVTASPAGGIWVVGAAWNDALRSYEAVAAWWDGQAWNEVVGRQGGTELYDVIGSLDDDGWAVGRAGQSGRTTRVCIPPQSGIFGGRMPNDGADPIGGPGLTAAAEEDSEAATADDAIVAEAAAETALLAKKSKKARKKAALRRARRKARRLAALMLPEAKLDRKIVARNVTRQAGLAETTGTYGAVVADFDADGVDDLFIGRHGQRGRMALNRDGVFVDNEALTMPSIDRHGCAAADIDGSGLPDLYCAVGGLRGSGLKTNELWLDPGGPSPVQRAVELGVSDPTGRGRATAFLEARQQRDTNLVITNSPVRVDGLPSVGRTFRTLGDGRFGARKHPGFAPGLGALAVQGADFDNDGREDLVLVTGGPQAPAQEGTRLYRNTRRGLVDVTRAMGIEPFGEVDAELLDLNGDKKLDLVQLAPSRIRISVLRNGTFRKVWGKRLSHGRAVASGDVNGDGLDDIYIVRSNGERNSADVMLVNRKRGTSWTSMLIPQVYSGSGEDAFAIDHDGNGMDDFLVLNGQNTRGPIQLTGFYKR
jgi:hypothetical protein